jgi:hypothetical protein
VAARSNGDLSQIVAASICSMSGSLAQERCHYGRRRLAARGRTVISPYAAPTPAGAPHRRVGVLDLSDIRQASKIVRAGASEAGYACQATQRPAQQEAASAIGQAGLPCRSWAARWWGAPVSKFSLTVTHRLFPHRVLQRTDCRLMRVLFCVSIGGYLPHAPPVVTDHALALAQLYALGPMAFQG